EEELTQEEMAEVAGIVAKFLPPEELMSMFRPEERLAGLDPREVLSMFRPEERLAGLDPAERLAGLDPAERLAGLDPEEIKDFLQKLSKKHGSMAD
ncbi:hypothetical protein QUF80_16595, partial [Desulfococcaceae bacterium HSG8]|nr:hypothetical protein [Desulfococcaceae bacterium HSG8]